MNKEQFEEVEIDRWLEQMKGEEIRIPFERLEEGTKKRIGNQKLKHYPRGLKVAILLGGIIVGSCVLNPNMKALAQNIIERILGDAGLNKALEEGYPHIAEQEIIIGDYKAKIYNIYIDEQRFNMDFTFDHLLKEENVAYELYLKDPMHSFDYEVGISYSSFFEGEEGTSITMVGTGVKKILEQSEIQIPLVLTKHDYNLQKNTVLGETVVTLMIPDALRQESKVEEIKQTIQINNGWIKLEQLEMAPTMMTLSFASQTEDKVIMGLKDLSVENNRGEKFCETMSVGGGYTEAGDFEEFVVPSMYFSKYESFEVKASGYLYKYKEPEVFTVKINETFPKQVVYEGKPLVITKLSYDENKGILKIGVSREEMTERMDSMIIDGKGIYTVSMHSKDNRDGTFTTEECIYSAQIPKKESYEIALEITFLEEQPIVFTKQK